MTSNPTKGQKYLAQLKAEFWGAMHAAGAHTEHCYDMAEDGKRIIRPILNSSPIRLRIDPNGDDRKGLSLLETAAGKFVVDQLDELRERYEGEMKRLGELLCNAALDRETAADIRKEHKNMQRQKEADEKARRNSKRTWGRYSKKLPSLKGDRAFLSFDC